MDYHKFHDIQGASGMAMYLLRGDSGYDHFRESAIAAQGMEEEGNSGKEAIISMMISLGDKIRKDSSHKTYTVSKNHQRMDTAGGRGRICQDIGSERKSGTVF